MKKVLVLGSTGSIGTQALEVIGRSERLQAVGLAAGGSWETTVAQAREHGVPVVALANEAAAESARGAWSGRVLAGSDGVRELIATTEPDLVLNAIVGAAGLASTVVALSEGIDVALANKESLVLGGELVMALAEGTGARLLPVDSEHSALFQLIAAEAPGTVERLVLTASGGPFRGRDDLAEVSVADALAHPTWRMGGRITIDSATRRRMPSSPGKTCPSKASLALLAASGSASATVATPCARAASSSRSQLEPAARPTTSSSSEPATICSAWVPIDPVAPRMTSFLIEGSLAAWPAQ